jgi:putative nucleotidyltransferase with HDIG domain
MTLRSPEDRSGLPGWVRHLEDAEPAEEPTADRPYPRIEGEPELARDPPPGQIEPIAGRPHPPVEVEPETRDPPPGGAAYRVGQAREMLSARMTPADHEEAMEHLDPELRRLFLGMSVRDQRHSLRVLHRLQAADPNLPRRRPSLLAQAALLHDVGKAETPLGIPGRSLVVLAGATGTLGLLQRVPRLGLRVARYLRHPEIGARMLIDAGAPGALAEIVAEHQARAPRHPETRRLQAADGRE